MQYRVLRDIDYEPPGQEQKWRHWAAGDILDTDTINQGLPPLNINWLLAEQVVEEV